MPGEGVAGGACQPRPAGEDARLVRVPACQGKGDGRSRAERRP